MDHIDLLGKVFSKSLIGRFPDDPFKGVFDGNGYQIRNLTISGGVPDQTGLFGYVSGAATEIKNLGVDNVTIEAYVGSDIGGLVGYLEDARLSGCYVTGHILGSDYAGGLVGFVSNGSITNCYTQGLVEGIFATGGIYGANWGGTLTNNYAAATVQGFDYAGGFGGIDQSGVHVGCFWNTDLTADGFSYIDQSKIWKKPFPTNQYDP